MGGGGSKNVLGSAPDDYVLRQTLNKLKSEASDLGLTSSDEILRYTLGKLPDDAAGEDVVMLMRSGEQAPWRNAPIPEDAEEETVATGSKTFESNSDQYMTHW